MATATGTCSRTILDAVADAFDSAADDLRTATTLKVVTATENSL